MSSIRKICSIENCGRYSIAKNLCGKHYQRHQNGVPMDFTGRQYHGLTKTVEYTTWSAMKQRCYYTSHSYYEYYGGRGIVVCDRWLHSFSHFLEDMGKRPEGNYSIERINPDGNYEPTNCVWATAEVQANNTRRSRYWKLGNASYTVGQWSKISGVPAKSITSRLKLGWSVSDSVFTPVR